MTVKDKVQKIFSEVFEREIELVDTMTAHDVEEWDSLNHIQIIATIEKTFGIRFRASDILDLKNVGDFLSLIEKELSKTNA